MNSKEGVLFMVVSLCLVHISLSALYILPTLQKKGYFGIKSTEVAPYGHKGALHQLYKSKMEASRVPLAKVVSQIQSSDEEKYQCSSLHGPLCKLKTEQHLQPQRLYNDLVMEIDSGSLSTLSLSFDFDLLVLVYASNTQEGQRFRLELPKVAKVLQNQILVAALDVSADNVEDSEHNVYSSNTKFLFVHKTAKDYRLAHTLSIKGNSLNIHDLISFLQKASQLDVVGKKAFQVEEVTYDKGKPDSLTTGTNDEIK